MPLGRHQREDRDQDQHGGRRFDEQQEQVDREEEEQRVAQMLDDDGRCTVCGMREIERHQESAAAVMTSASTMPVTSTVETMSRGSSRRSRLAIDHEPQEQRIDRGHRRRLGRRHDAGHHPAEEDHRRHQRPVRPPVRRPRAAQAGKSSRAMLRRRAISTTMAESAPAISSPGTTPAENPPIETSALTP
ncbi:MAG: hypothetical protein R3D28_20140 [Geminicoccaceae bacterium]